MSVRLFCNVVFAWLCERVTDNDERERLVSELYAPMEGVDAVTRTFLSNLAALAGEG